MGSVLFLVATRDGQSERIGLRIARECMANGLETDFHVLSPQSPFNGSLDYSLLVIVAAVRYGHHLSEAEAFLENYSKRERRAPLALISVNLTARKPDRQSAEGNPYLRKTIRRYALAPTIASAVAGRVDYSRYGWLDRLMMRVIMAISGGPTDGVGMLEFTDWDQVHRITKDVIALANK
jgi:menaquinone-dependent protoporphyrinogen oxidase